MYAPTLLGRFADMHCAPSPWAVETEDHVRRWVRSHDLVRSGPAGRRFDRTEAGDLTARAYSTATTEAALATASEWIGWLFLTDDQLDEGPVGKDPVVADTRLRPLRRVLTAGPDELPPSGDPLCDALADVWSRIRDDMPPEWRHRFTRRVLEYLDGCAWEAANRARGLIPSAAEFVPNRRMAGAIWPSFDLLEFVTATPLPELVHEDLLFRELRSAAADVVCWTDDVLTVDKERVRGDVHNFVIVTEHATGCDTTTARARVESLIGLRLADFEARAQRLPSWFGELGADETLRQHVMIQVQGLRDWMRGHLDWGMRTVRYREVEESPGTPAYVEDLSAPASTAKS